MKFRALSERDPWLPKPTRKLRRPPFNPPKSPPHISLETYTGYGYSGPMAEVTTPRADEAKTAYLNRLRRIEGQVRGLEKMVDEDKYCIDILTQVSAVTKALEAFALALLDDHLGSCIKDAVRAGGSVADDKIHEASQAIARLVR